MYKTPGESEVRACYRLHNGPRMFSAGIGVQFHYNQVPGIHFKVEVDDKYKADIVNELERSMNIRFPDFPEDGSIWITHVDIHPVETKGWALVKATRMAVENAHLMRQPFGEED